VTTTDILNNTIDENDINDSFVARNSNQLRVLDVRTLSGNSTSAYNYDPSTLEI